MSYLHRRADSRVAQFRVRVPADLAEAVRGRTVLLSFGPGETGEDPFMAEVRVGETVKCSLRTTREATAKARTAQAVQQLERKWTALRSEPVRLPLADLVRLSQFAYDALMEGWGQDPGPTASWMAYKALARVALEGRADDLPPARPGEPGDHAGVFERFGPGLSEGIDRHPPGDPGLALEARFGLIVDWITDSVGLRLHSEDRPTLLAATGRAAWQAGRELKKRSRMDFSPDPDLARFGSAAIPSPAQPSGTRSGATKPAVTITGLLEAWAAESVRLNRAPSTIGRYRGIFQRFVDFLGHDDAARVTAADVVRYKNGLLEAGLSRRSVRDVHLPCLRAVLKWATGDLMIKANPAEAVTLRRENRSKERPNGFTPDEALTILKAASAYVREGRESEALARAKKWVPWLCAYTGARIADVTALTRERFRQEGTGWVVLIRDKKTRTFREVPVHGQLIEMGLMEFVNGSAPGPLFHDPESPTGPQTTAGRVGEWVRKLGVDDPRVQPNHGWRHYFVTRARAAGMDSELREAIIGHRLPGLGDTYGDLVGFRREMDKLPKIDLGDAV